MSASAWLPDSSSPRFIRVQGVGWVGLRRPVGRWPCPLVTKRLMSGGHHVTSVDDITRFTLMASAAAAIQAVMACLMWWQARATRIATDELADVETARFGMSFAGALLQAAETLRQQAVALGLNQDALELERRVTEFLQAGTADLDDDEREDIVANAIKAMAVENARVFSRIRDFHLGQRNALGERGGAAP